MRKATPILLTTAAVLAAACSTIDPSRTEHASPVAVSEPSHDVVATDVSGGLQATQPVVPVADRGPVDPTCDESAECNGESCCTSIVVPGGTYHDERAGDVKVASFALDKYEVTVSRVRKWDSAGASVPAAGEVIGHDSAGQEVHWDERWDVQRGDENRGWARYDTWMGARPTAPKNFIDWYTAAAVCHYAGGRLPTDAEWRYAAVGGDENREFPWGKELQTPDRAVYNCMGDGDKSCSLADILPVGSRPLGAGRWGHMDLAGSMFEWTADAGGSAQTVNRGGGFCYIGGIDRRARPADTAKNIRKDAPGTVSHMVGVRCAHDLPEEPGHGAVATN